VGTPKNRLSIPPIEYDRAAVSRTFGLGDRDGEIDWNLPYYMRVVTYSSVDLVARPYLSACRFHAEHGTTTAHGGFGGRLPRVLPAREPTAAPVLRRVLEWAVICFIIAIVAAVLGARGIAGVTMTVAKWFVIIFLVLAVISIVL
jgi:uncharacterized membrane protein YtjA (UPF0391 family)